jgi:nucleoside-diphosphate-sugar epimerase
VLKRVVQNQFPIKSNNNKTMVFGLFGDGNRPHPTQVAEAPLRPGFASPRKDTTALVTGSSGLCGARLVELLLERGTKTVIAFDIAKPNAALGQRFADVQSKTGGVILVRSGSDGDLTNDAAVESAFGAAPQVDIVYHIAALVGPFFDRQMYFDVNLEGTKRIVACCKRYNVPKLVYSSSPGTRFTGADIEGLTEDELPAPKKFLATYAETKYLGEIVVKDACCDQLLTIAVAPHQIYGPHDNLFLMKFLETAGNGRLRIFGTGGWKISMCYVDNYAHGLMCAADALYPKSPALAKFFIVTDDEVVDLWGTINEAVVYMGFENLNSKFHLPIWFLYLIATIANIIGIILQKKFKLNYFSLKMVTMHRYFDISGAKMYLKYSPILPYKDAWLITLEWFKGNWLPGFQLAQQQTSKKVD